MKVVSVNRGAKRTVKWKGQSVETGIFKFPVEGPIHLGEQDVVDDDVIDRRFHGGVNKAVYAYSYGHYAFWKEQFPKVEMDHGMFGENLTVEGMNEHKMNIGSTYRIGTAVIQVCQPRQPCFKLGIRFGTQSVLKTFVNKPYSGVYFRVLEEGDVRAGDEFKLINEVASISIADVYRLLYHKETSNNSLITMALQCEHLPDTCKESIRQTQGVSTI